MAQEMIELIGFRRSHFDLLIQWSPTAEILRQWAGPRLHFPLTHAQLSALLELCQGEPPQARLYAAQRRSDQTVIGHGELGSIDHQNGSATLMRVLVGPADARRRGYGQHIVRQILNVAFGDLKLHRVQLHVYDFNHAAIRCYERIGFQHEGTLRAAQHVGKQFWNVRIMSLLRREWQST